MRFFLVLCVALLLSPACSEPDGSGAEEARSGGAPDSTARSGSTSIAPSADPTFRTKESSGPVRYEASLSAVDGSGVHGGATVWVRDEEVVVTVEATGLTRGVHAQHVHASGDYTSCGLGRIEINLDESLDADSIGPFPFASSRGTIVYQARSRELERWRTHYGRDLDLAGRIVALHVASEDGRPPGPVAACGPLRRP